MNIVFYVNDLSLTGTPEFVKRTANELADRGHTIQILISEQGTRSGIHDLAPAVSLLPIPVDITVAQFNTLLRELGADILDYNGWAPLTHLNYAIIGKHAAIPVVAHYHCMVARFTLRRVLGFAVHPASLQRLIKDWFRKTYFDGHIVCYQAAYERARFAFGPMNRHKLYALPCGILLPDHQVDDNTMLGAPSLIQVGKLTSQKGPMLTLQAFQLLQAECPEAALTFVGQGDQERDIKAFISKHRLKNVTLAGEATNVQPWYLQANINCLPSKWEAMPFVLKEAGALGIPSITTGRDGQPEAVLHGKTGFIIAEDDHTALFTALKTLASDPKRRLEMGKAARQHMRGQFGIADMCDRLLTIYKEAIQNSTRKRMIKTKSLHYV
jgi:glycosyltransferase involved in cell wall biosynthesis